LIGGFLVISGVIVGVYVVNEWIKNITHVPLTIFATLLILTGILMFIFAILSDLIVSMHRENMRTMRKILKEMEKS
jgi:dolichol-phosphate mannosyltransferase